MHLKIKDLALKLIGQSLNVLNLTTINFSKYSNIAYQEASKYFYNLVYNSSDFCIKQVDEINTVCNKKKTLYQASSVTNIISIISTFSREKRKLEMKTRLSDILSNYNASTNCFYKVRLVNNNIFYTSDVNLNTENLKSTSARNYILCSIGNLIITDFMQKFVNIEVTPMTICSIMMLDSSKKIKNRIIEMIGKFKIELEIINKSFTVDKLKSNDKLYI